MQDVDKDAGTPPIEKADEGGAQGSESKAEESKTKRQRVLCDHDTDDTEATLESGVDPSNQADKAQQQDEARAEGENRGSQREIGGA